MTDSGGSIEGGVNNPRELDELVAEYVMGWTRIGRSGTRGLVGVAPIGPDVSRKVPRYSTSMSAAWEVVEKMHQDGWDYEVANGPGPYPHMASFYRDGLGLFDWHDEASPVCICTAALRAVMGDRPAEDLVRAIRGSD